MTRKPFNVRVRTRQGQLVRMTGDVPAEKGKRFYPTGERQPFAFPCNEHLRAFVD